MTQTKPAADSQIINEGSEPIAIVGIGCRFPGGVNNPATFWQLLVDEKDAVTKIPSDRIDTERYFAEQPATPGRIMSRWGGYLDHIDKFDAYFFGIAPLEAQRLDPQQRLLLEVAWEALADAGQPTPALTGSDAGVFIGLWLNDYEGRLFSDTNQTDFYMTTGSGRYAASGRLSFFFGLQGPSITIDTACSSSLVSVHLACQSLRQGECGLALAGGANVILQPHITIAYSQSKMMAPDGHCKFGDARADGYVRSEGAGLVVLKRLSDALADGDRIYAVIRGSAVNNDGRSSGYLATPSQTGQMEMLRRAYRQAGIQPNETHYIEAHGTGTRAGDPVEVGAIGKVLSENRTGQPLYVGSVKTNLGHTEGAAGVAGLIKIALAVYHRQIPASLHLQKKNPDILWDTYHLDIPQQLTPWPSTNTAVAGVSAFGIAGTNAHVVVQEMVQTNDEPGETTPPPPDHPRLLPISAHTPAALKQRAQDLAAFLQTEQGQATSLIDLGYTTAVRHTHQTHRLTVPADNHADLSRTLASVQPDEADISYQMPKIAFIFPGQGAQWVGMGRELLQTVPAFRNTITRCEAAMQPFVDWSLTVQLQAEPDDPNYRLNQIDVIQPVLLAIEIALAELWQARGVQPDALIGHSMGEVGAAYVAGALSLTDAMRIICRRSQLMRTTSGQGAMALVELTLAEAKDVLYGREDKLSIAVSNSPRSTVIAGDPAALDEVLDKLQADNIFCRKIKVDVASHSPQMEPLQPKLRDFLEGLQPQAGHIPIYTTSTAHITDGADLNADFWVKNLRQPVQFSVMVSRLLSDGFTHFIEMSPHPILLPAVQQVAQHEDQAATVVASLKRREPEQATLLDNFARLYTTGVDVDWRWLYPHGRIVSLPLYPWQRERFWFESSPTRPHSQLDHPFLDMKFTSADGDIFFNGALSLERFPYLADHRVGDTAVFPAAALIETTLAAAQYAFPENKPSLTQIKLREALPLNADVTWPVQIIISRDMPDTADFKFYSRSSQDETWTLHASGIVRLSSTPPESPGLPEPSAAPHKGADHYRATANRGLPYGPAFQGVQQFWSTANGVLGQLLLPEAAAVEAHAHLAPPALLDAAFQLLLTTLSPHNTATYLPVSAGEAWSRGRFQPDTTYHGYAVRHDVDGLWGDVYLFADNTLICAVTDLQMEPLPESEIDVADWMYTVQWQPQPLPEQPSPTFAVPGQWLIFTDAGNIGHTLSRQLSTLGETCHLIAAADVDAAAPDVMTQIVRNLSTERPLRGILHLWNLDQDDATGERDALSILHLVQAIAEADLPTAPRLWLVTPPIAGDAAVPSAGSLWGLGRVIDHEQQELTCKRIALADQSPDALWAELWADDNEREVTLRADGRTVSRLVPYTPPAAAKPAVEKTVPGQPYRVAVTRPGVLDNLVRQPLRRTAPGPGQVEIAVRATGLNFMNVMSALGIYPGYKDGVGPLGIECAGVVTAVAPDVDHLQPGDAVMGLAFHSLSSHVCTDARLLVAKPDNLTFAEAATIPVVFLTAHYALNQLGRMRAEERVLIHAATGGVGQAAVQLANRAGAEIFATAGSPEKRSLLRELGVSHVMDSRSLTFASETLAATDGEGVDLVLNSLAGEAVIKGLEILRPYGRFLEIGKVDIYDNNRIGLLPFQKNLSYFAIDLDRMARERPSDVGEMLTEIGDMLAADEIRPLPLRTFSVTDTSDAFRFMAQAKHIGKIVITHEIDGTPPADTPPETNTNRASYLISGGFGALGLITARWLVEREPCDLILLGRSQPDPAAQVAISTLEQSGARVVPMQADVTSAADLRRVLNRIAAELAPLRGVVHAAGVLADSTLQQMDAAGFRRAFAPKADGAWHLHTLTRELELDFFVLFSSVTALLGTPGQGNYAAGNAFLDALAHQRRSEGLPALTLNWGPWADVGLAAADERRGSRLAERGLGSLTTAQGITAMALLWTDTGPQTAVMPFDLARWQAFYPAAAQTNFYTALQSDTQAASKTDTAVADVRTQLSAANPGRPRHTLLNNYVREQVAQVLRLNPERIPLDKPLKTLGIDSLMTLELRNRLENSLNLTLSATLIWNYPTVAALSPFLADQMGIPLTVDLEPPIDEQPQESKEVASGSTLDDLSHDEIEAMLADELSEIDDLLKDF